jgi:two-component system, NtrC family, response regulator HydG
MGIKRKILIVEDEFVVANDLAILLGAAGHEVTGIAVSVDAALEQLSEHSPDLVLIDIQLQGSLSGIDLAKMLRKQGIAFIYLSANSNRKTFEAAKRTSPYGFLVKPFREKDVLVSIEIAWYLHESSVDSARPKLSSPPHHNTENLDFDSNKGTANDCRRHGLIGESSKTREVCGLIETVAPTSTSVLILGDTGTGKERVADCIHLMSPRSRHPFIKVNCAALPANLVEATLFGNEVGAFTGAVEKRIGKFEAANKGTIFLDEVGELDLENQAKLLRVLQEKEIEPIGGKRTVQVDVRIIAATNRNLEKEVSEGRFRIDLYYRLNVFPIALAPLRERRDDIILLANHFLDLQCKRLAIPPLLIHADDLDRLREYSWPGNIRELENIIERSVVHAAGAPSGSHIRVLIPKEMRSSEALHGNTLDEGAKKIILAALEKCHGKIFGVGGAAELLGINGSTLYSKMKKLGIDKKDYT